MVDRPKEQETSAGTDEDKDKNKRSTDKKYSSVQSVSANRTP